MRKSTYFNNLLIEMNKSEKFKNLLYFFDWEKINHLKTKLIQNKNNSSDSFFSILLTLYFFLKKIKKI